jgi:transposase-like protein
MILIKSKTHQELLKKLSKNDQINLTEAFSHYEKLNFAKAYKIDYKTFFITNYKIIKFYLNIN